MNQNNIYIYIGIEIYIIFYFFIYINIINFKVKFICKILLFKGIKTFISFDLL